jgi:hypothetical protein
MTNAHIWGLGNIPAEFPPTSAPTPPPLKKEETNIKLTYMPCMKGKKKCIMTNYAFLPKKERKKESNQPKHMVGFRVWLGLGFRVWLGLGFRVWVGFRV